MSETVIYRFDSLGSCSEHTSSALPSATKITAVRLGSVQKKEKLK